MVRDAVPLGECGRALVIKLRHHGDVLLAAPVLAVLKAHAPRLEVDALVYDDTAEMLAGHPALSELHVVGRRWRREGVFSRLSLEKKLFGKLKKRSYDLIVHLSEQPRGAWLARSLGARYSVAPAMNDRGRFWRGSFTHLFPLARRRHQVEVNLDALRRIGIQPGLDERKVAFVPGVEAEKKIATLVGNDAFVHLHAASRWRFKCLSVAQNAELADRLAGAGFKVVLTAAPDSAETLFVEEIVKASRSKPVSLAGQLSIRE
ncbi:MAG TPA: putative lipopolysaccharide heptosyltransferase III, partial [Burkholderiales bacterium]|nr:putative lipopolysaccharide heptosyltransferase III [Burkholderiales bacterium]